MSKDVPLYVISSDDSSESLEKFTSKPLSQGTESDIDSSNSKCKLSSGRLPDHSISDSSGSSSDNDLLGFVSVSGMMASAFNRNDSPKFSVTPSPDIAASSIETSSSLPSSLELKDSGISSQEEPEKKRAKKGQRKVSDEAASKRKQKAEEKQLTKALKDVEKEAQRSSKPQECAKSMKIVMDKCISNCEGFEALLNVLLDNEVSYSIERNIFPSSILWYRRVAEVTVLDNQVTRVEKDNMEKTLLVFMQPASVVDMVHNFLLKKKGKTCTQQTLLDIVNEIKEVLPQMNVICVTIGMNGYLGSKRDKTVVNKVSKQDVDEAVMELELLTCTNFRPLANMTEFGQLLVKLTKAIAEAPFKREKQQLQEQFSWYAQADSSCPVKIEKDGSGSVHLWQQQIQQFSLVGKEVSEAIAALYPSPLMLVKAYQRCSCESEAEKLLQDIVVRRDYGPLGTTRRVGRELSYKMYRFFTSTNGLELLQRS